MLDEKNQKKCFTKKDEIHLFQIEPKKSDNFFIPADHQQVVEVVYGKVHLEKVLKHLYLKFHDDGLARTLIHRIYDIENREVAFYVPQLVFMCVQKQSKLLRKLLVLKTSQCANLCRLILWNLKAFTVLMKERDQQVKKFVDTFEGEILSKVVDKKQFNHSEKAFAMITTASLILKTMPEGDLKKKLKKFIVKFNFHMFLSLKHSIKIPFNRAKGDEFNSNYVVGIINGHCSCFPTRKRVPYRIVIETIDEEELKNAQPNRSFYRKDLPQSDKDRDLYDEVKEKVEKMHGIMNGKFARNDQFIEYPFVRDEEYFQKMTELTKFAKNVENEEKAEKQKTKETLKMKLKKLGSKIIANFSQSDQTSEIKKKTFDISENDELKRFNATYIPTLPSHDRKSGDVVYSRDFYSAKKGLQLQQRGKSDKKCEQSESNIKIVQEEPKWTENPSVWGESWHETIRELRKKSPFKSFKSLKYRNVVIKGGDDLRQQIICMQLIYKMQEIMQASNLDIFIRPYEIIVLSQNSGLLEFVPNSISVDALKKQKQMDLLQFYLQTFSSHDSFMKAKNNFIRSLVGSSILTYILRLKDRHNGNILIDNEGRIIHIDFGFILGMSPGGINFQSSPFKFTWEYVQIMGGKDSPDYDDFKAMFYNGMVALRKRYKEIILLLEIMMDGSDLECFQNFNMTKFKDRFKPNLSEEKFKEFCEELVEKSCMNSRTVHYDTFQKLTNNIMP